MGKVELEDKWPVLGRHKRAAGWLRVWTDLGRAPRTIDAYARGLADARHPGPRPQPQRSSHQSQVSPFPQELHRKIYSPGASPQDKPEWARWPAPGIVDGLDRGSHAFEIETHDQSDDCGKEEPTEDQHAKPA